MRTACAIGLLVALAGCADTVAVDPPEPAADVATLCSDLLDDAPGAVAGQDAVRVAPEGAGRAWGSPAIVMRCGVERPADLGAASRCDMVDGIGWFTQEDDDYYVFTTIGRTAYVEVSVPRRYDPPADALTDLAATIDEHDPVEKPCV
ncbi:DUF3515 domain-containing protein [Mumia zhuanghuii]|uniref:DUF3515 domain-containing protein n=1 Tax=Mumia zhuanghuii TaxID=2585211 RepID=A0A5Q6S0X6_9ACTN|nr:DUF3515 domain-containing protein [Mumia zhuanghuii]